MSVTFYSLTDSSYLPGLVALVNSLRLVGHEEPIVVVDCGLTDRERELLSGFATLVDAPAERAPHFSKWIAVREHPDEVMVVVDADVIVTRPLAPLIALGAAGKIGAFVDGVNRFDPRWGELLGLGPLTPQPYVNSGVVVLPLEPGLEVLDGIREGQHQIDLDLTLLRRGRPADPFYFLDQDVVNAVLASLPREGVAILEARLAPHPPFAGLRIADARSLRCRYPDGLEPLVLHHVYRKPWLTATRSNVYSRLLSRLLVAADLPLQLERERVPTRFHPGVLGGLERRRADGVALVRSATRGRLGVRRRLAARRASRERRSTGAPTGST